MWGRRSPRWTCELSPAPFSYSPVREDGQGRTRGPGPRGSYLSRPGRSGFSLQRTGRMAMLRGLRGWVRHWSALLSFGPRFGPRIRPKTTTLLSGPFLCSPPVLYRGMAYKEGVKKTDIPRTDHYPSLLAVGPYSASYIQCILYSAPWVFRPSGRRSLPRNIKKPGWTL